MVRMVSIRGGRHNGAALGFRTEHYQPCKVPLSAFLPKKVRKPHSNRRKGKMPNLRGGGQ